MRKALLVIELPTSCFDCPCSHYAYGATIGCGVTGKTISAPYCEEKRIDDCPLIPVPEHCRLIDADALKYSTITIYGQFGCQQISEDVTCVLQKDIERAPTIIQAEEGE